MGIILPFYRWKSKGSEKLDDTAKVSPPRAEPGFGPGSVLPQPGTCFSMVQASVLLGKLEVQGSPGSPSQVPDHGWSLLASAFHPSYGSLSSGHQPVMNEDKDIVSAWPELIQEREFQLHSPPALACAGHPLLTLMCTGKAGVQMVFPAFKAPG